MTPLEHIPDCDRGLQHPIPEVGWARRILARLFRGADNESSPAEKFINRGFTPHDLLLMSPAERLSNAQELFQHGDTVGKVKLGAEVLITLAMSAEDESVRLSALQSLCEGQQASSCRFVTQEFRAESSDESVVTILPRNKYSTISPVREGEETKAALDVWSKNIQEFHPMISTRPIPHWGCRLPKTAKGSRCMLNESLWRCDFAHARVDLTPLILGMYTDGDNKTKKVIARYSAIDPTLLPELSTILRATELAPEEPRKGDPKTEDQLRDESEYDSAIRVLQAKCSPYGIEFHDLQSAISAMGMEAIIDKLLFCSNALERIVGLDKFAREKKWKKNGKTIGLAKILSMYAGTPLILGRLPLKDLQALATNVVTENIDRMMEDQVEWRIVGSVAVPHYIPEQVPGSSQNNPRPYLPRSWSTGVAQSNPHPYLLGAAIEDHNGAFVRPAPHSVTQCDPFTPRSASDLVHRIGIARDHNQGVNGIAIDAHGVPGNSFPFDNAGDNLRDLRPQALDSGTTVHFASCSSGTPPPWVKGTKEMPSTAQAISQELVEHGNRGVYVVGYRYPSYIGEYAFSRSPLLPLKTNIGTLALSKLQRGFVVFQDGKRMDFDEGKNAWVEKKEKPRIPCTQEAAHDMMEIYNMLTRSQGMKLMFPNSKLRNAAFSTMRLSSGRTVGSVIDELEGRDKEDLVDAIDELSRDESSGANGTLFTQDSGTGASDKTGDPTVSSMNKIRAARRMVAGDQMDQQTAQRVLNDAMRTLGSDVPPRVEHEIALLYLWMTHMFGSSIDEFSASCAFSEANRELERRPNDPVVVRTYALRAVILAATYFADQRKGLGEKLLEDAIQTIDPRFTQTIHYLQQQLTILRSAQQFSITTLSDPPVDEPASA